MSLAIIYNILPHYRIETFKYISNQLDKVDIFYGYNEFDKISKSQQYNLGNVYIFKYLVWQKGVLRKLHQKKYKFIILTGEVTIISNWFILIWIKLFHRKTKTFLHSHGINPNDKLMLKLFRRCFYSLSTSVLVYDAYQERYLRSKHKISAVTVYNSLPQSISSVTVKQMKNRELVYVGRIDKHKKIDWLIQALSNTGFSLLLIGPIDFKFKNYLINLARKKHVMLKFHKQIYSNLDIKKLVQHACGAVYPGNCGLGGLHMLSMGIPIMTHKSREFQTPEYQMINDTRFSVFYNYGSFQSFRSNLNNLLKIRENLNPIDLELYINFYQPKIYAERIINAINAS